MGVCTYVCMYWRQLLQVRCYDWDSDGSHDLIGEFYTTLGELTHAGTTSNKVCMFVRAYKFTYLHFLH